MVKTVVVGGNFAGLTAALEVKRRGGDDHDVVVIDKNDDFLFVPSLIWVPFKRRNVSDISIPRRQIVEKRGVEFIKASALSVDPDTCTVKTDHGEFIYDQLVIATGPKVKYDIAPGVAEYSHYIGTPDRAMKTRAALDELKQHPGPVVIGATQGAGCIGAAYEFLFNIEKWLREEKIRDKVDLYWITPETFLGHFGIDGMAGGETMLKSFMKMFNIHYRTEVGVEFMTDKEITLTTGESISYSFAMLVPPFVGVDFVTQSPKLSATANGYLPVGDDYRHKEYPNIWAAGISVDVKLPFMPGKVPFGTPKTGYPSDETGKIVAKNIIRVSQGKTKLIEKPWGKIAGLCVMDAGKKEVLIISNNLFKPRLFAIMIPNVIYDFSKVFVEKYFLWKTRHGYSFLP